MDRNNFLHNISQLMVTSNGRLAFLSRTLCFRRSFQRLFQITSLIILSQVKSVTIKFNADYMLKQSSCDVEWQANNPTANSDI